VWVQDAADIPPAPDRQPTDHKPADEAAEAAIQAEPIEQVTADEPRDLARLAPHPRRLVAFLVDWAGVALSFGAAALLGELQAPDLGQFTLVTVAVAFGIALAVVPGLSVWLTGGQTIGKALFGLTERRIDGARPKATLGGLAWAVGRRSWGYLVIDVLGIGALAALVSPRRRCLHDLAFGSEVVYTGQTDPAQAGWEARGRAFVEALQSGLERNRERFGWALLFWDWQTKLVVRVAKVVFGVAAVVFVILRWVKPAAAAGRAVNTTPVAETPPATAPSTPVSIGLWAGSAAVTGAVIAFAASALGPPPLAGLNVVFSFETVGQPKTAEIYLMKADGSDPTKLTSNQAEDDQPDLFHDRRIVFTSDRDGNYELYVMDADGTDLQRLTTNPAADWSPTWSRNGKGIAFVSDRDGNGEIYVMDADAADLQRLTTNPADDHDPSWSPDGKQILFFSQRCLSGGAGELYAMDPDGTKQQRMTSFNKPSQPSSSTTQTTSPNC
jgi:uncharacterized RDD family membrane protein YckC